MLHHSFLAPVISDFLRQHGIDEKADIHLAGMAGSRRAYYRMRQGKVSFIILVSPPDDQDFGRFLRITQFYRLMDFPVPRVYCIDDPSQQVVLEDLGDISLGDLIRTKPDETLEAYQKVMMTLLDLQTRCYQRQDESPDIHSRVFGIPELLWESNYFLTQYWEGHRGRKFTTPEKGKMDEVFLSLAQRVNLQPKSIMHRDFQSQNIMVQPFHIIRVIDFQGSRLGSIYYDLASLLLDPYVELDDTSLDALLRFHHEKSVAPPALPLFTQEFYQAGLQRIMQALGAYCFLSRVKGITAFEQHIAPGERRLKWLVERVDNPEVKDLFGTVLSWDVTI